MSDYVAIESMSAGLEDKVKQSLKYKTGKFVWRVRFSTPLDARTVNNVNLYVTDTQGTVLNTSIHYDAEDSVIEIEPLEAYAQHESYTLNITTKVQSRGGQKLKTPVRLQFKID
jgi:hypothetical protein